MSHQYLVSIQTLLNGLTGEPLPQLSVSAITMDSRQVKANGLFLSLAKNTQQRHQYLCQALAEKPALILYTSEHPLTKEDKSALISADVPAIEITDLDSKAGEIAARFYNRPSDAMTVIAVTGTNGKTSVSQFIAQALQALDYECGVIGTLGIGRLPELEFTGMTTPDPVSLQAVMAEFRDQGCQYVTMEASSHALEQGRLNSIDIDIAVFTNLTRDHLDYHQTMEAYAAAKKRLFAFSSLEAAVINSADNYGREIAAELDAEAIRILSYNSYESIDADLYAQQINLSQFGMGFEASYMKRQCEIKLNLLGRFNVDNILATLGVLLVCDVELSKAIEAISNCCPVPGRMQVADSNARPQVVIDYAHTPDALEQALKTLTMHLEQRGDLWCVFGCGGDRDTGKRPLMGKIAESYADRVVITDDNPRTENSRQIIDQILAGCDHPDNIHTESNRKLAITYAVNAAALEDIVLVAGKGHEHYQEINNVKYPFSDFEVISQALAKKTNAVSNREGAH